MMIPRLAFTTLLLTLCALAASAEEAVTVVRVEDLETLVPQREWWENNVLAIATAQVGAIAISFLSFYLSDRNARKGEARDQLRVSVELENLLSQELAQAAMTLNTPIAFTPNEPRFPSVLFEDFNQRSGVYRGLLDKVGALSSAQIASLMSAHFQISKVHDLAIRNRENSEVDWALQEGLEEAPTIDLDIAALTLCAILDAHLQLTGHIKGLGQSIHALETLSTNADFADPYAFKIVEAWVNKGAELLSGE